MKEFERMQLLVPTTGTVQYGTVEVNTSEIRKTRSYPLNRQNGGQIKLRSLGTVRRERECVVTTPIYIFSRPFPCYSNSHSGLWSLTYHEPCTGHWARHESTLPVTDLEEKLVPDRMAPQMKRQRMTMMVP